MYSGLRDTARWGFNKASTLLRLLGFFPAHYTAAGAGLALAHGHVHLQTCAERLARVAEYGQSASYNTGEFLFLCEYVFFNKSVCVYVL